MMIIRNFALLWGLFQASLVLIKAAKSSFSKHGMYWSGNAASTSSISTSGKWISIENSTMSMTLEQSYSVLIAYSLNVEGLRILLQNPLPRSDSKDILQVRCTVDGIPIRASGAYVSAYDTEDRFLREISNMFVANLSVGAHSVSLQWKKIGLQMSKWQIAYENNNLGYSLSAIADHEMLIYSQETSDRIILSGPWKDLTDSLTFTLDEAREVLLGYSFTAQPQLASFIKDRSMEFINSRIVIDGAGYVEGAAVMGASSWNPFAGTVRGLTALNLTAGEHSVKLQWRKNGAIFESWGSNPSYLDGFAGARNMFVMLQPIDAPVFNDHSREVIPSDGTWRNVGDNIVSFSLAKQSAVLITYSLPVSQYGNPNLDSNVWQSLVDLEARLLIDSIAYNYASERLGSDSRVFGEISGNLGLILGKGSHSIVLQWRANGPGANWTTLNNLNYGFAHGAELLAMVSSENTKPVIKSVSSTLQGYEDTPLVINGISIGDVDSRLHQGMYCQLNISVSNGQLSITSVPEWANPITEFHDGDAHMLSLIDTIGNVNYMLRNLTYRSPLYWFGNDTLVLSLSDLGEVGFGPPLFAQDRVPINIASVDNPFTLEISSSASAAVVLVGESLSLGPFILEDIDSNTSTFRAQIVAFCGYVSVNVTEDIQFTQGGDANSNYLDFTGVYGAVKDALLNITYRARSSCTVLEHGEYVSVKVIKTDTSAQTLSLMVHVTVLSDHNIAPTVRVVDDYPIWNLKGLVLESSPDLSSAVFSYLQMQANIVQDVAVSSGSLEIWAKDEVVQMSDLAIFTGVYDTYIVGVRYGDWATSVVSSSYVPASTASVEIVAEIGALPEDASGYDFYCILDHVMSPATLISTGTLVGSVVATTTSKVVCNVSTVSVGTSSKDVAWLQLAAVNGSGIMDGSVRAILSDYTPLFISSQPVLGSFYPGCGYRSGKQAISLVVDNAAPVDRCFFGGISNASTSSATTVTSNAVLCSLPVLSNTDTVTLSVGSSDGKFFSEGFDFRIVDDPTILSVALAQRLVYNDRLFLVVNLQWDPDCSLADPQCSVNGSYLNIVSFNSSSVLCDVSSELAYAMTSASSEIMIVVGQVSASLLSAPLSLPQQEASSSTSLVIQSLSYAQPFVNSSITIYGFGFGNTSCLLCSFGGNVSTTATPVSGLSVSCIVPPGAANTVALETCSGDATSNTVDLTVRTLPTVDAIYPVKGASTGGTFIIMQGTDFSIDSQLVCWFGNATYPAVFVNESAVGCISPTSVPGTVELTLTVDSTIALVSSSPLYFEFRDSAKVYSVAPAAGSINGSVLVQINGTGFDRTSGYICRFGDIASVSATVLSDTDLTCVAPAAVQEGAVRLTVNTSDGELSAGALEFRYVSSAAVVGVEPSFGSSLGGTTVVVYGVSLFSATSASCLFGSTRVPALVVNSSAAECESPALSEGSVSVSLELDGYEVTGGPGAVFTYVSPASVTGASPLKGSTQGGTNVSVLGTGFRFGSSMWCEFGQSRVPATYVSGSSAWCISPAHVGGDVELSIVSGLLPSTATVIYSYVTEAFVLSARPLVGPITGGTVVAILINNVNNEVELADIYCKFGDVTAQAIVTSASEVRCLSPATRYNKTVALHLFAGSTVVTGKQLPFTYVAPAILVGMTPTFGSSLGGTTVVVYGVSLFSATSASCLFGSTRVPALVVNSSAAECESPALSEGSVSVSLELDGYEVTGGPGAVFTYVSPASVTDASPLKGSTQGGTNITVKGSGFRFGSSMWCEFDQSRVPATFVSGSSAWCISPAHAIGVVNMTLWSSGLSSGYVQFSYETGPAIYSVFPSVGLVQGGSVAQISGSRFDIADSELLLCYFGANTSPGQRVNSTAVLCDVPAADVEGAVDLRVGTATGIVFSGSVSFIYTAGSSVVGVEPDSGSTNGGTAVLVYGVSLFCSATSASCLFGSTRVPALVVNSSAAECESPALSEGSVSVSLELDGYEVTGGPGSVFTYVSPATVSGASPLKGSTQGGTNITVIGSGFLKYSSIECHFDSSFSYAKVSSDSELSCLAPSHPVGAVNFTLSTDGIFAESTVAVIYFTYFGTPVILGFSPATASIAGGVEVNVTLSVTTSTIDSTEGVSCWFGNLSTKAQVLEGSLLTCVTPAASSAGVIDFGIQLSNGDKALAPYGFRFVSDTVITTIEPTFGSSLGGTTVVVYGVSLFSASSASCLFGSTRVPALVVNSSAAECESPALSEGSVSVSLELDGYEVTGGPGAVFTYVSPASVTGATPLSGSTQGGTNVTVAGSGFLEYPSTVCTFGSVDVDATIVSDSELICLSPSHPQGAVTLSISIGTDSSLVLSDFTFTYARGSYLVSVMPSTSTLSGGNTITVSGEGFSLITDSSPECVFNSSVSASATVLSDTDLTCVAPTAVQEGAVRLTVNTSDGELSAGALEFRYVSSAAVVGVEPSFGSSLGGTTVVVYGVSLFSATSASCLFGSTRVPALVVNSSAAECESPALSEGSVSVSLELDGYEVTGGPGAVFTYVSPASVSDVSPLKGSTQGGTNVSVSGSGFRFGSSMWCEFGQSRVPATYVSGASAWCISPAHSIGVVNMTLWSSGLSAGSAQFSYEVGQLVTSISPSLSLMQGGVLVLISGSNFYESLNVLCVFGDLSLSQSLIQEQAVFMNSTTVKCLSPTFNTSGSTLLTVIVGSSDSSEGISYPFGFEYLETPVVREMHPSFASRKGGAVITIYGANFYSSYVCTFGNISTVDAFVKSSSVLQCYTPPSSAAQTVVFALNDTVYGEIYSSNFSFLDDPVISSPQVLDNTKQQLSLQAANLAAASSTGSSSTVSPLRWVCSLDGYRVHATVVEESGIVLCSLDDVSVANLTSVFISDESGDFVSNTVTSFTSVNASWSASAGASSIFPSKDSCGSSGSFVCAANAASVYSYADDSSSLCAASCADAIAINAPPIGPLSALKAFNSLLLSSPLESFEPITIAPTYDDAVIDTSVISAAATIDADADLFMPLLTSQCSINGMADCVVDNADSTLDVSDYTSTVTSDSTTNGLENLFAASTSILTIDSVDPASLNTRNTTWVVVQGRWFSNSTFCLLNNQTYAESVVLSRSTMECLIPAEASIRSRSVVLSLIDYSTLSVSTNSFSLYYNDMEAQGLLSPLLSSDDFGLELSSSGSSSITILQPDVCLSSGGCDYTTSVVSSACAVSNSDPWLAFLQIQTPWFNNQSEYSLCKSDQNSTGSALLFNYSLLSSSYTWNATTGSSSYLSSAYAAAAMAESANTVSVWGMYPSELSVNASSYTLYFPGAVFSSRVRWCVEMAAQQSECFVESSTLLQCPISTNLRPGEYAVQVLMRCSLPIANYTLTLTAPVGQSFWWDVATATATTNTTTAADQEVYSRFWSTAPVVESIKPLSGSVTGSSTIQVRGSNMDTVTHCKFISSLDSSTAVTVSATVQSSVLATCTSPSMSSAGVARIYLGYKNSSWIPTDSYFTAFLDPVFYATPSLPTNGLLADFDIVGDLFPLNQLYCKVLLSSGYDLILAGLRLSSQHIRCLKGSHTLNSGRIIGVQVSFNGYDFIDILAAAASDATAAATSSSSSLLNFVSTTAVTAVNALNISSNILVQIPALRNLVCNGHADVAVPMPCDNLLGNFSCLWDGVYIGRARYSPGHGLLCRSSSRPPGMYRLVVQDTNVLSLCLPQVAEVSCLPIPQAFSVSIAPRALSDGVHKFAVSGINFLAKLTITCELDRAFRSAAAIDSLSSASCLFSPMLPGIHTVSIYNGDTLLYEVSTCVTPQILRDGGVLASNSTCLDSFVPDIAVIASTTRAVQRSIRTFLPRFGMGSGGTQVEITADGINYSALYTCSFGDHNITGSVIDIGRLLCVAPSSRPSNVTLSITSSKGATWCCGYFVYYSPLRIVGTSPRMIDARGGSSLYLNLSTSYLPQLPLYCFFGAQLSAPAYRISEQAVSCSTPRMAYSTVNVYIGSEQERLSNGVAVLVATLALGDSMSITPNRGTHQGGTNVTLTVMSSWVFESPMVSIGGVSVSAVSQGGNGTYTFTTPAMSTIGRVTISIYDGAYSNAPVLTVGSFFFERSADVSSLSPSSVLMGGDVDVLVFGSYFKDSRLFTCFVGETHVKVPSRWLSDSTMICSVPGALTGVVAPVSIRVSNNGQDISATVTFLTTEFDSPFVEVSPLQGFSTGGTTVTLTFRESFAGPVICNFGSASGVYAFRTNESNYFCLSPGYEVGTVGLQVVTEGGQVIYSTNFTYWPLPRLISLFPTVLQSGARTTVSVYGENFSSNTVVRFRSDTGATTDGTCSVRSRSNLTCTVKAPKVDGHLSLDISVNSRDYVNDFGRFQVFEPAAVVYVTPMLVSSVGGDEISIYFVNMQSAFGVKCQFSYDDQEVLVNAYRNTDDSVSCIAPALPLDLVSPPTFAVVQSSLEIFGPIQLRVREQPFVSAVSPATILSGVISQLMITFQRPLSELSSVRCDLGGVLYDLVMANPVYGYCSVNPLQSGNYTLTIGNYGLLNASNVAYVKVIDRPDDLQINVSSVLEFATTTVSVTSPGCLLPSGTFCSAGSGAATVVASSSCEIICSVIPVEDALSMRFDLCLHKPCDSPIFSSLLDVLPPVAIVAAMPPTGTVLGGTTVTLYGSGFVNDATLRCVFGDADQVDAMVISTTQVRCLSPPQLPGNVSIRVLRRGVDVSVSVARFEYVPLLATMTTNTSSIFALGGTVIVASTSARAGSAKAINCRFENEFVPAVVVNDTSIVCVSPAISFEEVQFALSASGEDLSTALTFTVITSPDVLHVEPVYYTPGSPVDFTLVASASVDPTLVSCMLGEFAGTVTIDGYITYCRIPKIPKLQRGALNLNIAILGTSYFEYPMQPRNPFVVTTISPQAGIASSQTPITIASMSAIDSNEYSTCCFQGQDTGADGIQATTPALLISTNELRCSSPKVDILSPVNLALGVSGPDGVCQATGFQFRIIPTPRVTSVSVSSGPTTGGTTVELSFQFPFEFQTVFCRIGAAPSQGTVIGDASVGCITRSAPAGGSFDIELSVNGQDFFHTGFQFEYLDATPSGDPSPVLPSIAPLLYYTNPVQITAGHEAVISVYGKNFMPGVRCLLGQVGLDIDTVYVSDNLVTCSLPVHAPGSEPLTLMNPPRNASLPLIVDFVASPSQTIGDALFVQPSFGPKTVPTLVSVAGFQLGAVEDIVYCLVGNDWSFAVDVTLTSAVCTAPISIVSGNVKVRLANANREFVPGTALFQYVLDPYITDARPAQGTLGTPLLIKGSGFLRMPELQCLIGDVLGETAVLDDKTAMCTVPELGAGVYRVTFQTNGQHVLRSGVQFTYFEQTRLDSLWPVNGPAFRGSTAVTIYGSGFLNSVDMGCMFDATTVSAVFISDQMIRCRAPSHRPGRVNVTITIDGAPVHPLSESLQFVFVPDASVDKVSPESGYTPGGYPVFVFGSNFINTSSLGCMFADMASRGVFLSNTTVMCLAPSPIGRSLLASYNAVVRVTNNGFDYTESNVYFNYSQPCAAGFYCPGNAQQPCPNGTYCPANSNNFTLCAPGYFQPLTGQQDCIVCAIGYFCPDYGLSRPVVCPPGQICDSMILAAPAESCRPGFYCLNGTKSTSLSFYQNDTNGINQTSSWSAEDYVTGVISFVPTSYDFSYKPWPYPAVGQSRVLHPPEYQCDGYQCVPGSMNFTAEAPYPCPLGHYCRSGATSQIPIPKNFSTPQRCFDGFFCPRGSTTPEGYGPCPNAYFCPTPTDALACPQGHYCPGVGNRAPIECYPGTFNPFDTRANCSVCPMGYICPGWGLLLPEPCPAGFVCAVLGLSLPVVMCPQGYYCEEGTITLDPSAPTIHRPIPCPPGSFCLGGVASRANIEWIPAQPFGAYYTQTCVEGTYCQTGAYLSSGTGLCFLGHYCPPNSSFPTEVPLGNFASSLGSVAPTLCFPGTYAPLTGQSTCDPCPAGHSCSGYGTYIPSICPLGTYRMLVDAVSCSSCMTGTFSTEVGAPDISMCLACPPSRVCGVQQLYNLANSTYCPAGYICGYGTDFTRQFLHTTPAGYFTANATVPSAQYDKACLPGYFCNRGTPAVLQTRAKCPVGYFCPSGTPGSSIADTQCPIQTTSISGAAMLASCVINVVDVCDKTYVDPNDPFENITYYSSFSYTKLDGSGSTVNYDSSVNGLDTGEIRVTDKIQPVNTNGSSVAWVNDTIEAFRTCPTYGSAAGGDVITVIGRNFQDSGLNFCKWRACISANNGQNPQQCRNRVNNAQGNPLSPVGEVTQATYITRARFISVTRMECEVPPFTFNDSFVPSQCMYVSTLTGAVVDANTSYAKYSYVQACSTGSNCMNLPETGYQYFYNLSFPCSADMIAASSCTDTPQPGLMMNPCVTAEALVEVSNDGMMYSGGNSLTGTSVVSTSRWGEAQKIYENFKNFSTIPTFAVFTYVRQEHIYTNSSVLIMDRAQCLVARYFEEGPRPGEQGWYLLKSNEAAHVQMNLSHLPPNLVYDQHYKVAIFIQPSRCAYQLCSSLRVRLTAAENVPCMTPMNLSSWFLDPTVLKNTVNNFTVYALDDLIFKVEVHIMYGAFSPYVPLFRNTTSVIITSPQKAQSTDGITGPVTRQLSSYVSYENREIKMQYLFCTVYLFSYTNTLEQALNLPPRFSDYAYGRALIMYNVSDLVDHAITPLIIDTGSALTSSTTYWDPPSPSSADTKEIIDAYFETFHGMTFDGEQYTYAFTNILMPYFPYFSNCYGFDSYMPLWMVFENPSCALPDTYGKTWYRYKHPALVDQDSVKVVGPFDFLANPIADWCELSIQCNYEETLGAQGNYYRWFEAPTNTELFQILRYPVNYSDYTGRSGILPQKIDGGGATIIEAYALQTEDNFIKVRVDHSAGDAIPGCTYLCFPRKYTLEVAYYQQSPYLKVLIFANLIGDNYDFNAADTSYTLSVSYYALNYIQLFLNFAFDVQVFVILFTILGAALVFVAFFAWVINRLTTHLLNPPDLKIWSLLTLTVPPPAAGITLAIVPIWIMISFGNLLVYGVLYTDPSNPLGAAFVDQNSGQGTLVPTVLNPIMEVANNGSAFPLTYNALGTISSESQLALARTGRTGVIFMVTAFCCFFAAGRLYFPKGESKREHELAERLTEISKLAAKEELWNPVLWKKLNFMYASMVCGIVLTLVIEFSFWTHFGTYEFTILVMLMIIGKFAAMAITHQLQDAILCMPLRCAFAFVSYFVIYGSPNFLAFLLAYLFLFGASIFERVYLHELVSFAVKTWHNSVDYAVTNSIRLVPKFMKKTWQEMINKWKGDDDEGDKKREVEGIALSGENAESVEPILSSFGNIANDTLILWYMPFFVYLLMQFRTQIYIPVLYGIHQSTTFTYLVFQIVMICFRPIADVFNLSQLELFHGWKVYEYLVYSRYRFVQRETRWKGMESSLDECIDETLRRIDQMCFSSQYYLMLTIQFNGIVFVMLGLEVWLRVNYSPFSDSGFALLALFLAAIYIMLEWLLLFLARRLNLWRTKHENTSWHILQQEDDDLDLPDWEDVKGASHDNYLMNQRITSDTFRYKFLNYNRSWLINQLPSLLTPRTLRRSRPYLINQLARVISHGHGDISDDSGDDAHKFGPVALSASSRNIIRWWLAKARRRMRLKQIVDPLIRRARGAECEVCLSRRQLQVTYDIDVDKMAEMYDQTYPGDEEIDQVQWKSFWTTHQKYHTICLSCLTKQKGSAAQDYMRGLGGDGSGGGGGGGDEPHEEYPEWGPVYLSAASKAILLNWYRKAQQVRGKKRKTAPRREKVVKAISDDEGEEEPMPWINKRLHVSDATRAIAVKWTRTARARLQKKAGRGAGLREADLMEESESSAAGRFKSGKKSAALRK